MSSGNECICMLECTINNVIRLRDREEQKERARCTACTVQQWASATAVPAPTYTSTTRGHGTSGLVHARAVVGLTTWLQSESRWGSC